MMIEKKLLYCITTDLNNVEISRFVRDLDKPDTAAWMHKHLLWAYSNDYAVDFTKATAEDIDELNNKVD